MAPEIERITNTLPTERIEVARQATASENISKCCDVQRNPKDREGSQKRQLLRALIDQEGDALTIRSSLQSQNRCGYLCKIAE